MKRLLSLFKERDGADAGAGAAETREAWAPDGQAPTAARPTAPSDEGKADMEMDPTSTASSSAAAKPAVPFESLLPIEGHALEGSILGALKSVYDPEIPVNIYELGLIYDVKLTAENDIYVKMTLTAPGCPVAQQMPGMVRAAVEEHVPEARAIDVEIVWDPPWRPDMMSEAARLETGML